MTEENLEQLRQDRDAYKQAYENMCVFYKQLVAANQKLAANHEAVEHTLAVDEAEICRVERHLFIDGVCARCGIVSVSLTTKA